VSFIFIVESPSPAAFVSQPDIDAVQN